MTGARDRAAHHLGAPGRRARLRAARAPEPLTSAPPLLLCNGIGASLEALQPLVDALDPHRGVVRFDVPGVGRLAAAAGAVHDGGPGLLGRRPDDARSGTTRFDVLGLSWGGGLAQQLAFQSRRRVRRVVLVATGTGSLMVPARPHVLATMLTPAAAPRPRLRRQRRLADLRRHRCAPTRRAARSCCTRPPGPGPKRGYYYQLLAGAGWSSLPGLPFVRQPVLVMAGDDDPIIPLVNARIIHRLLPHSRLHVYRGGHLGILTESDELAPVVDDFLTSQEPVMTDLDLDPDETPFSDFLGFELLLEEQDRELLSRVRAFMTREVEPIINDHWTRADVPPRDPPRAGRAGHRRPGLRRPRLPGARGPGQRPGRDGDEPRRPLDRHLHGRARRPGHGLDRPVRLTGAAGAVAARRWPGWS